MKRIILIGLLIVLMILISGCGNYEINLDKCKQDGHTVKDNNCIIGDNNSVYTTEIKCGDTRLISYHNETLIHMDKINGCIRVTWKNQNEQPR